MRNFSILLFNVLALSLSAQIQLDSTAVTVSTVAQNLDTPWEILWGPDNHIWFTERRGTVNRLNPVSGAVENLITITEVREQGEAGLLGMALHPDFSLPGSAFVYLVYTYRAPALTEKIVRYTYQGSTLVNPLVILDNIPASNNHDGSRIIVTDDRKLLVTTGDALNTSLSQNSNSLAGKVLRLNLDGSVPVDNPDPSSYVWSIGHRNAQGLVQAPDGTVYSSEHGPANDDELNIIFKDHNYGWPNVEGFCNLPQEVSFCTANNVTEPIFAWTPTLAVAGLDYYDHPAIPEWKNSLLLVNLKERDLRVLQLDSSGHAIISTQTFLDNQYGRLRDVCVAPDGRIFVATSNRDGRNNNPDPTDDRILKLENVNYTSLAEDVDDTGVELYPNPASDRLYMQPLKERGFRIYSSNGTPLSEGSGTFVNIQNLAPGFYILEIQDPEGTSRKTFIKQ